MLTLSKLHIRRFEGVSRVIWVCSMTTRTDPTDGGTVAIDLPVPVAVERRATERREAVREAGRQPAPVEDFLIDELTWRWS